MHAKIKIPVLVLFIISISIITEHPRWDRSHSLRVGSDGGDVIEDVDEDEEESDEERHPARDNLRGNEEAHPGSDHKQGGRKVVDEPSDLHTVSYASWQKRPFSRTYKYFE